MLIVAKILIILFQWLDSSIGFTSFPWTIDSTPNVQTSKPRSLWIFFLLDIILWILTLICFVTIFSGGGMFLLLVFLLGTAIRAYIVFILYEFMTEELKIHETSPIQAPTHIEIVKPTQENKQESNETTNIASSVILEVEEPSEVPDGNSNHKISADELKVSN